jgi:hypothetical protein
VCLREQGASGVRQRNLALRAVEQPNPELLLELANLLGDRGLSDVQPLRGPAEMQFLGDCDEVSDVAKLHACSITETALAVCTASVQIGV